VTREILRFENSSTGTPSFVSYARGTAKAFLQEGVPVSVAVSASRLRILLRRRSSAPKKNLGSILL